MRRRSAVLIAIIGALALSLGALAYPAVVGSHMLPVLGSPTATPATAHPATGDKDGNNTTPGNDTGNDTGNDQGQANGTQDDQGEANETENDQGQNNEPSDMNQTQGNDSSDGNDSQNDSSDVSSMTVLSIVPDLAAAAAYTVPVSAGGVVLLSPVELVGVLFSWSVAMPSAGVNVLTASGL